MDDPVRIIKDLAESEFSSIQEEGDIYMDICAELADLETRVRVLTRKRDTQELKIKAAKGDLSSTGIEYLYAYIGKKFMYKGGSTILTCTNVYIEPSSVDGRDITVLVYVGGNSFGMFERLKYNRTEDLVAVLKDRYELKETDHVR